MAFNFYVWYMVLDSQEFALPLLLVGVAVVSPWIVAWRRLLLPTRIVAGIACMVAGVFLPAVFYLHFVNRLQKAWSAKALALSGTGTAGTRPRRHERGGLVRIVDAVVLLAFVGVVLVAVIKVGRVRKSRERERESLESWMHRPLGPSATPRSR